MFNPPKGNKPSSSSSGGGPTWQGMQRPGCLFWECSIPPKAISTPSPSPSVAVPPGVGVTATRRGSRSGVCGAHPSQPNLPEVSCLPGAPMPVVFLCHPRPRGMVHFFWPSSHSSCCFFLAFHTSPADCLSIAPALSAGAILILPSHFKY